jgi:hypothetical protein
VARLGWGPPIVAAMVRRCEGGAERRCGRSRPGRHLALALALATAILAGAGPALADTVPVLQALTVEGPLCVGRDDLAAELALRLGRDAIDDHFRVVVRGEVNGASFSILRDGSSLGERRLDGMKDCAKLRSALAVAIAVAIDAAAIEPAPNQPVVSAVEPIEEHPPVVPDRRPKRLSVGVFGAIFVDVLPVVVVGGGVSFRYRPLPPLSFRASFIASDSGTVQLGTAGSHASLLAGRLDGCLAVGRNLLVSHLCAGVAAGGVRADGFGLTTNYSIERPWGAALLRGDLQLRVASGFHVTLGADGLVPFVGPRYEVDLPSGSIENVQKTPMLGFAADLGVAYDFL